MNKRKFRDVEVSEIGLGTWQLGSAEWGDVDKDKAKAIVTSYLENGGNFIDTADIYGMGRSEKVIGEVLKATDQEVFVATKLGRRNDDDNGWPQNFTYDAMKRHVENSLENLGVDQLFLEQLHCIDPEELKKGRVFDHFRKLQEEKLIRYWGASVETSEEALICMEQEGIASLQIIFNIFRQHLAEELFDKAKDKNIAIIVRVPLASGLLSGKFDQHTTFGEKDHRNFNANGEAFNAGETFSGVEFHKGVELSDKIKTMLPDDRMPQWALRWILDHPEVTTVIPGASKVEQVKSNIGASTLPPLPDTTHQSLKQLYEKDIHPVIRGHY